jgi:hypothetical protein
MKNIILSLLIISIISSCKKENENVELQPGSFSFSRLENYNPNLKSAQNQQIINIKELSQSQYSFDLGDIKTSVQFYFLLMNVGDLPIFDVELSSDNPNFQIFPTKISYLGSIKNFSVLDSNLILPIISVGIEHGKRLNGNGYGTLLNMGENLATITIRGKTIQNSDTILLSINPSLVVNAIIMDIKIYVDNQEINLYNPNGSLISDIRGIGTIPYYLIDYINKSIKIENTGNTPIKVQALGNSADTIYLNPNSNSIISNITGITILQTMPSGGMAWGSYVVFMFNSSGTAVINEKLKLKEDGNAYFALFIWLSPNE